jgi:hypothetical protein
MELKFWVWKVITDIETGSDQVCSPVKIEKALGYENDIRFWICGLWI